MALAQPVQLRAFYRIPAHFPVRYGPVGGAQTIGVAMNLSRGGLLLQGPVAPQCGQELVLALGPVSGVDGVDHIVRGRGSVAHVTRTDGGWDIGVQFSPSDAQFEHFVAIALMHFCESG